VKRSKWLAYLCPFWWSEVSSASRCSSCGADLRQFADESYDQKLIRVLLCMGEQRDELRESPQLSYLCWLRTSSLPRERPGSAVCGYMAWITLAGFTLGHRRSIGVK
jgi:hypothetical protein